MKFVVVLFAASMLVATTSSVNAGGLLNVSGLLNGGLLDGVVDKLIDCIKKLLDGLGLSKEDFAKLQPSIDAVTDLLKANPLSILDKDSDFSKALADLLQEISKYAGKNAVPTLPQLLDCVLDGIDLTNILPV